MSSPNGPDFMVRLRCADFYCLPSHVMFLLLVRTVCLITMQARHVVEDNNLSDRVTVLFGRVEVPVYCYILLTVVT